MLASAALSLLQPEARPAFDWQCHAGTVPQNATQHVLRHFLASLSRKRGWSPSSPGLGTVSQASMWRQTRYEFGLGWQPRFCELSLVAGVRCAGVVFATQAACPEEPERGTCAVPGAHETTRLGVPGLEDVQGGVLKVSELWKQGFGASQNPGKAFASWCQRSIWQSITRRC